MLCHQSVAYLGRLLEERLFHVCWKEAGSMESWDLSKALQDGDVYRGGALVEVMPLGRCNIYYGEWWKSSDTWGLTAGFATGRVLQMLHDRTWHFGGTGWKCGWVVGSVGGGLVAKSCLTLATPWTVACEAPLSMGFLRQAYWNGLPVPSPVDLPDPGIEPEFPALQADSLPSEPRAQSQAVQ